MKFKALLVFMLFGQFLSAQIFTEFPLEIPFDDGDLAKMAIGDLDGDNDQDIILVGDENFSSTEVYLNDGLNNFTELTNSGFEDINNGSIAMADVDGDNDLDVLISGEIQFDFTSKLYLNDGQGNFTEMLNLPFESDFFTSIVFADVDGDNDPDLFLSGFYNSKLYINDGAGNYTESTSSTFEDVLGSASFADIDGDADQDLLIIGFSNSNGLITKLYINDGQGIFSEVLDTPFEGLIYGAIGFADIDADGDQDILLSGDTDISNPDPKTQLYINDGLGNFTEMQNTPFEGTTNSSIVFVDTDGDNDQDVLIGGLVSGDYILKLFINDGLGNYTEMMNTPFEGAQFISIGDFNGDNAPDILLTNPNSAKVYLNDGASNFTIVDIPFEKVEIGSIAFADIDGDNDQDLMITGINGSLVDITKLYTNDGQGNFTEVLNNPFQVVRFGAIAFSDVDGDGDQDLLLTGANNSALASSILYINDGAGNFTESLDFSIDGVSLSAVAFADVDGDNDQDLLITGTSASSVEISKLYINDGLGNFSEMTNTPFEGVHRGSVAFADVDGDNDQDIVITGDDNSETAISKLYINDGIGNYTEMMNTPFDGVRLSSIAFSDVDNDNDFDLLITGQNNSIDRISKLYINDGLGNFTELLDTPFDGAARGSVDFADVDLDGDQDVFIAGGNSFSNLYLNDGAGNFTVFLGNSFPFPNLTWASVAFADVDGDNDFDLFVTGKGGQFSGFETLSKMYFNDLTSGGLNISGLCYYDLNENQTKDPDEIVLTNQVVQISPNSTFNYPTINGQYRFFVENGDYQLTTIPTENWQLTTDPVVAVNLQGQSVTNINFGFIPNAEIQLVEPDISSGPTRCSFDVPFWLNYQNNGTTFENGFIEFSLPENTILQEAFPNPDEIMGNKLFWNYTNLAPSELNEIRLTLKMPDASNLGDTLNFTATSFLIDNNQNTIQNTVYNYNPVLNCAFDPNDKTVNPPGDGNDQLTLFDTELEYRIRFQNTGTDTAFTVRIEDDLDSDLDWNTFRPVSASHPYEVNMDVESGRVTFLFSNILLPDSTTNEVLSHGFVKYKISPLDNLPEWTSITNEASIFFDFNQPIITNMTLNRLVSDLTNTTETTFSRELKVTPNPFQKSTIFKIKEIPGNRGTLNIYNTNGSLVFSQVVVSNMEVTFKKDGLASGIYFYNLVDQNQVRVFRGKVIKH